MLVIVVICIVWIGIAMGFATVIKDGKPEFSDLAMSFFLWPILLVSVLFIVFWNSCFEKKK